MYNKQYFGTDGIRGKVGTAPITPDFMLKLGWAVGKLLAAQGRCKILIGKDTRISGYMLESALEAGLAAAGADVLLVGPMPTPAIAFLTRTLHAQAGIVVSASHNPFADNGIKFFGSDGNKFDDQLEADIEHNLTLPLQTVAPVRLGKARRIADAQARYIEFCKRSVAPGMDLMGLKIVVDCAHGATYQVAPHVFAELGAEVTVIHNQPDGFNINDACGSTSPSTLQKVVVREQAHLGIAFDGDGDRVIMVNAQGEIVDGDELLFIITQDRIARHALQGGIVGTVMTNMGLELAMAAQNIPFIRAKVGDRHVLQELKSREWELGGESSGHIICLEATTTGDGIIAALQVLCAIKRSGRTLAELAKGVEKFPQVLQNVHTKSIINLQTPVILQAVQEAQALLNNQGRVLLRCSGTEPVVRVMVEGADGALVAKLAQQLADVVEQTAVASELMASVMT